MTRVKSADDISGRDNRTGFTGGTKFPTVGSTAHAHAKLQQSSAEVGPNPTAGKVSEVPAVKMPSSVGGLPKLGGLVSAYDNDPLTKYLAKVAEDGKLPDNKAATPEKSFPEPSSFEYPTFRDTSAEDRMKEVDAYMKSMFENYKPKRGLKLP